MKKIYIKFKTIVYSFVKDLKYYSFHIAINHMMFLLFLDLNNVSETKKTHIHMKTYSAREQSIQKFLKCKFKNIIEKYKKMESGEIDIKNNSVRPIWMIWWQGMENAPDIIKLCTKSKFKCSGRHPINIITKENYQQYVDIPMYIIKKVDERKISITHLSDIIRVTVLAQYGGLWLDASIFCNQILKEYMFDRNFYTCKSPDKQIENISRNKWCTYAIGGEAGNILFCFLKDFFFDYCKKYDEFIDYFLFDHIINIAYDELDVVRKMIDNNPYNNVDCEFLIKKINDKFEKEEWDRIVDNGTVYFKLAWKKKMEEYNKKGDETYYYYLKHNF